VNTPPKRLRGAYWYEEAVRLREERDRLADALGSCACNCQWVNEQRTYHCRRCEALVSLPVREDAT
jgi:hypothetical protein